MTKNNKRSNRSVTVNFKSKSKYYSLIENAEAFIGFVTAFILSAGCLRHYEGCGGKGSLTRHSHYVRVRLNGVPIWRVQCTECGAVFTILPHFVLRYRKMSPGTAEKALTALSGGLSLEICAVIPNISPMSVYRLICSLGKNCMISLLTRCGLSLPEYFCADEKHSLRLGEKVYLTTTVKGHLIRYPGYTGDKSAASSEQSYRLFQQAGLRIRPSWKVGGILTDGFESTIGSMKKLFPGAVIGNCILHAARKVCQKPAGIPAADRDHLSRQFYNIFRQSREKKGLKVFSFGQKLRRFAEKVGETAGTAGKERISERVKRKKAGRFNLFKSPDMPVTTSRIDQAHNAIDRKLFMMKGFHHPEGSQKYFLNGLAILYNFIPYQRRAEHAGQCGVETEGGKLPAENRFLSLQILTSGGLQGVTTKFGGVWQISTSGFSFYCQIENSALRI